MNKLRNIISQLSVDDFETLGDQLIENKADKFSFLLIYYREGYLSEKEIATTLSLSLRAYYTLKSRLFQRIQKYLLAKVDGTKVDLLRKVASIPSFMFGHQKSTAKAILVQLEEELLEYDMPNELAAVYNALRKLNVHSEKYYHYAQLYNKHVAYTVVFDKVEGLLSDFHKHLGDYNATKDPEIIEVLVLIKKETLNSCKLYDSHRLKVFNNIIRISFGLFVSEGEGETDDPPIENMLSETREIINSYPKDTTYRYLKEVLCFLAFEYYHNLKLYKKEDEYFSRINDNLPSFLLCNFVCYTSKFLISKLEKYVEENIEKELVLENQSLKADYEPDKTDISNYINYTKYMAVSAYYAEDYNEAISCITRLIKDISLKKYIYAEIEMKLLLSTFYLMSGNTEQSTYLIRRLVRKFSIDNNRIKYTHATVYVKILKHIINNGKSSDLDQLEMLKMHFERINSGPFKMLSFIRIDDIIKRTTDRSHNSKSA